MSDATRCSIQNSCLMVAVTVGLLGYAPGSALALTAFEEAGGRSGDSTLRDADLQPRGALTRSDPASDPASDDWVPSELEALVGPIALYPDDLLAIVLPSATYPLQIVQAVRYLEARKQDGSLEPSEEWDDSIVALLNYPEALALLNDDLDWTWKLGEAVLDRHDEVLAAVASFRERAYATGNFVSDEHQIVSNEGGVIRVVPAQPEVIYIPYYDPIQVVVYRPVPSLFYYPIGYPLYYYPYPLGYSFWIDDFWGVSSAYAIGWHTRTLHVHHYHHRRHPYYGHPYEHHRYGRHGKGARHHTTRGYKKHPERGAGGEGNRWRPGLRGGARPARARAATIPPRRTGEAGRSSPAERGGSFSRTSSRGTRSAAASRRRTQQSRRPAPAAGARIYPEGQAEEGGLRGGRERTVPSGVRDQENPGPSARRPGRNRPRGEPSATERTRASRQPANREGRQRGARPGTVHIGEPGAPIASSRRPSADRGTSTKASNDSRQSTPRPNSAQARGPASPAPSGKRAVARSQANAASANRSAKQSTAPSQRSVSQSKSQKPKASKRSTAGSGKSRSVGKQKPHAGRARSSRAFSSGRSSGRSSGFSGSRGRAGARGGGKGRGRR